MLFDFNDEDLLANRSGHLSARQRIHLEDWLKQERVNRRALWVTYPVVALLVLGYFVVVPPLGRTLGPGIIAVMLVAFALILGTSYGWWQVARVLFNRWLTPPPIPVTAVVARTGRVHIENDGEHEHILLNEDELQSNVDAQQDERLWELAPDHDYTFYSFLGRTLTVEPVEAT